MTEEAPKLLPRPILMKLLNSRRRLVRLQQDHAPAMIIDRERALLDKRLDEFCAWAEEHAPELFYTHKEP